MFNGHKQNTNYGSMLIKSNSSYICEWHFECICSYGVGDVCIGISSQPFDANKYFHTFPYNKRERHFGYGYVSNGNYKQSDDKWNWSGKRFQTGDKICLLLNLKTRELCLLINEKSNECPMEIEVGDDINYRLAVILFGTSEVKLTKFEQYED